MRLPDSTVVIVDEEGNIVGLVSAEHIRSVLDDRQLDRFVVASDICAPAVSLQPDDDLFRAHQLFQSCGCPQIPVTSDPSEPSPRILGMLDYRDVLRAYEQEIQRRRES